jgi:hypothetical protein
LPFKGSTSSSPASLPVAGEVFQSSFYSCACLVVICIIFSYADSVSGASPPCQFIADRSFFLFSILGSSLPRYSSFALKSLATSSRLLLLPAPATPKTTTTATPCIPPSGTPLTYPTSSSSFIFCIACASLGLRLPWFLMSLQLLCVSACSGGDLEGLKACHYFSFFLFFVVCVVRGRERGLGVVAVFFGLL